MPRPRKVNFDVRALKVAMQVKSPQWGDIPASLIHSVNAWSEHLPASDDLALLHKE